jgi:methionine-gamma-lyase
MSRKSPQGPPHEHPESLMMSFGYRPEWSEGAVKPPIFQTSTFAFPNARAGKEFFARAYGLPGADPKALPGLIYSRINNPDLQILEERLCLWDDAEAGAAFVSGMAAIATTLLALVKPGEGIVFTRPVYGGTDFLLEHVLPGLGIRTHEVPAGASEAAIAGACAELALAGHPCRMVYLETPANPTLVLTDIAAAATAAHAAGALCAVDNTLLGLYQHPLAHGADLVLYSATKYLGGHSDIVAGAVVGSRELVDRIKFLRGLLGTTLGAHSAWLLLRSLETYKLRMTCARKNAEKVARWLADHPAVGRVYFPTLATGSQRAIYERQCTGPGALIAFELADNREEAAFAVLDAVRMIKLAVSLGGTESLIEHPATMTHSDIPVDQQRAIGITPGMIRLSVGIEHPDDLIGDLGQALAVLDAQRRGLDVSPQLVTIDSAG